MSSSCVFCRIVRGEAPAFVVLDEPLVTAFLDARPELTAFIHDPKQRGERGRMLASVLNEEKLRRVLGRMLDEEEFFSPYGIRSVSRHHAEDPYTVRVGQQEYSVSYLPAESDSGMFGGNSNWRGPIWMPVNGLIVRAMQDTIGLCPPMIISEPELDEMLRRYRKALDETTEALNTR